MAFNIIAKDLELVQSMPESIDEDDLFSLDTGTAANANAAKIIFH